MCRSHHSTTATAISQVDTANAAIHVQYSVPYTASVWGRRVKNMAHSVLSLRDAEEVHMISSKRTSSYRSPGIKDSLVFSLTTRQRQQMSADEHRLLHQILYNRSIFA